MAHMGSLCRGSPLASFLLSHATLRGVRVYGTFTSRTTNLAEELAIRRIVLRKNFCSQNIVAWGHLNDMMHAKCAGAR